MESRESKGDGEARKHKVQYAEHCRG